MPVTFSPAKHLATSVKIDWRPDSSAALLEASCRGVSASCKKLIQSSLDDGSFQEAIPHRNGFVDTVYQAYNTHHALIIRPDDVWLAILTQFNFYVNANAESLRSYFVAHEGQKALYVDIGQGYEKMARDFTDLMNENIVDESLREWILPNFTTTTVLDTTVAAMVMMATLKAYFTYTGGLACGIPRVTLEGEKADWEIILNKIEKLKEYGVETIAWYHLLYPVISRFVRAFDAPDDETNIDFWQKVAHHQNLGSGMEIISGWITAFCCFEDKKGEWYGPTINKEVITEKDPATLSAAEFWVTSAVKTTWPNYLTLDDTAYGNISPKSIPAGFAEVDVKLVNDMVETSARLVAGFSGARVGSSGDLALSETGENDVLRPLVGWWIFEKKTDEEMKAEADEKDRKRKEAMEVRLAQSKERRERLHREAERILELQKSGGNIVDSVA